MKTMMVFQSTLPRRERLPLLRITSARRHFNPRSREGSDPIVQGLFRAGRYFNPRSREGSDGVYTHKTLRQLRFQSTLPRRERPLTPCRACLMRHFNPRSREGSDASAGLLQSMPRDFNPRSREGSDLMPLWAGVSSCHFNPRSREGSDY